MHLKQPIHAHLLVLLLFIGTAVATAADWPTWRADSRRTANIDEGLPENLSLIWSRDLGAPKPCWPFTQYKLQFDRSYEPVVQGKRLFFGSMVEDCVTALDTGTGEELWKTFVDGPVRFAPVIWKEDVLFVSDDGHLYCADIETGEIKWKVRGGPADNRVFGNERLVSMWPARGGPVVYDGTVYFAASIWPFMGVFIHAVNAETGDIVWTNSGSSSSYILQPHSSPAFAGIAPQGYMAATEDKLFVAGGRSVPAVYDRKTGDLIYYDANTKYGGYEVSVADGYHCTFGVLFKSEDGEAANFQLANASGIEGSSVIESQMTIRPEAFGDQNEGMIRSVSLNPEVKESTDRRGRVRKEVTFPIEWELKKPINRVFFKAGEMIYCGTNGMIAAVRTPEPRTGVSEGEATLTEDFDWKAEIDRDPFSAIAADNKLFVVTKEGRLLCFGDKGGDPVVHSKPEPNLKLTDDWNARAKELLDGAGPGEGFAVLLGIGTGNLAEALVEQSNLDVIVFEPDLAKVEEFRNKWSAQGIYGNGVTVVPGNLTDAPISPYFACLAAAEDDAFADQVEMKEFAKVLFDCLRPYGGKAVLPLQGQKEAEFEEALASLGQPNAKWQAAEGSLTLTKPGPLPGSAPWTHQYGDVGNTVFSKDQLVKAPLGLLWFGGPSHLDVLPRHGHGPPQQIIGGRLFIQGIQVLSARDVYTGRILWRKELPNLNTLDMYYNDTYVDDPYDLTYNQRHIPGANQYGTNFIATEDLLYLVMEEHCLVIDPTTGDTVKILNLPELSGVKNP
ncbi:MAG: PQQ-like beta-propeller repeat protein, partial [Candidatus Omnitrophica bacterium]|nr:PQQ-like beta-propeller repeat protein [Candidatus Omnitrophota bacterium]